MRRHRRSSVPSSRARALLHLPPIVLEARTHSVPAAPRCPQNGTPHPPSFCHLHASVSPQEDVTREKSRLLSLLASSWRSSTDATACVYETQTRFCRDHKHFHTSKQHPDLLHAHRPPRNASMSAHSTPDRWVTGRKPNQDTSQQNRWYIRHSVLKSGFQESKIGW